MISLLLVVEGRALIRNRALSLRPRGQGAYLFFENQQNVKQSFDAYWTGDQKDWKTHLLSVGPSLLERLAEQLLQKTGSLVLRN